MADPGLRLDRGGFRGRDAYRPVAEPKVVLDAVDAIDDNLDLVRRNLLGGARS